MKNGAPGNRQDIIIDKGSITVIRKRHKGTSGRHIKTVFVLTRSMVFMMV